MTRRSQMPPSTHPERTGSDPSGSPTPLNANQQLAVALNQLSAQIGTYLFTNLERLTPTQRAALDGLQSKLFHWAMAIVAADIADTAMDLSGAVASLAAATTEVNSAANTAGDIAKVIAVAAAAAALGAAIVNRNPAGVANAIGGIATALGASSGASPAPGGA